MSDSIMKIESWNSCTLGEVAQIIDPHPSHRAPEQTTEGVPFVGIGDITEAGEVIDGKPRIVPYRTLTEHRHRYNLSGNTIGFGRVATIGKVIDFPEHIGGVTISPTMAIIEPHSIDRDFLLYSLGGNENVKKTIDKWLTGTTRSSLGIELLRQLPLSKPDIFQQKRIGCIFRVLSSSIKQTEALIKKYQQIKSGLMHDLFTRGITADGKLRPPREQAPELYKETPLGWIPKEWIFTNCSKVCETIIDCKNRTPPIVPDGHPVIRTPNVRNGEFVDIDLVCTDHESYRIWTKRGKPEIGDIVITREAPVGEVCMIPHRHPEACLGQRMMLYRPDKDKIEPTYFLFVLQSQAVQDRLDLISGGSTVGHVRVGDIRELWIFHPQTNDEQVIIGNILNSITKKIESEVVNCAKLKMKKYGLMHDLLTGKVQVKVDKLEVGNV